MRLRTRLFLVAAASGVCSTFIVYWVYLSAFTRFVHTMTTIPPMVGGVAAQTGDGGIGSVSSNGFVELLLLVFLNLVIAAALTWLASRGVRARVSEILSVTQRLSSGDLNTRLRDGLQDELGEVGRAVDEAVQRVGQQVSELTRDRARMEAILGGMVEGVLTVGAQGQVQLVNDAARRMLRLDDSAIGRRYVELIRHPDINQQLARALAGETPGGVELSLGRDLSHTLIARAAPVSASGIIAAGAGTGSSAGLGGGSSSGGGTGAVLVLHDITDLRRADRIRRDFVANVSHELRTPLTAIRGYVEALLDAPPKPEETRRFLEIIARHSARMERLVKDLLRLARLDAGQEALETAPCAVEALFAGVIADLTPTIEGRAQQVDVTVSADASTVVGDPAKLHDALRNLVENASNYSPERSHIRLTSQPDGGGGVRLRVADSGPGIPESDRQRVFERFYRVDKARSRESGGTGLGLSIVKHLIELHGGEVDVDNRPEGGAIFTIHLPRRPGDPARSRAS
jgi:two-component system phosphate regulon sensor histidine kinase PhoR